MRFTTNLVYNLPCLQPTLISMLYNQVEPTLPSCIQVEIDFSIHLISQGECTRRVDGYAVRRRAEARDHRICGTTRSSAEQFSMSHDGSVLRCGRRITTAQRRQRHAGGTWLRTKFAGRQRQTSELYRPGKLHCHQPRRPAQGRAAVRGIRGGGGVGSSVY